MGNTIPIPKGAIIGQPGQIAIPADATIGHPSAIPTASGTQGAEPSNPAPMVEEDMLQHGEQPTATDAFKAALTQAPVVNAMPTSASNLSEGQSPVEALGTAAGIAGASVAPAAAGAASAAVASHMGEIDKILKIGKALGWGSFGVKEAVDLYKTLTSFKK